MSAKQCIANKDSILVLLQVMMEEAEDEATMGALIRVAERIDEDFSECSTSKGSRKKRKPTARSKYMSYCMRKPDKGGLGRGMSDCSSTFRRMLPGEREKYAPKGE